MTRPISRRNLLIGAGAAAGTAATGAYAWSALVRRSVETALPGTTSTTTTTTTTTAAPTTTLPPTGEGLLVVVELDGGNDGLNTLVPALGAYRDARPTLAIPEADLVTLAGTDEFALHPALSPLVAHWESGHLAFVEGIAMPEQTRSHFTAMDTWWSATPGVASTTGWLGRWLDATLDGEPDPLRAVAVGGGSRALVGERSLATVIRNPEAFQLRTAGGVDADALVEAFLATAEPLAAVPELAAAQTAVPATVEAIELLAPVFGEAGGDTRDRARAGGGNGFTDLLPAAAGVLGLGVGTRVVTVARGGFDTHADQLDRQADLLTDLAAGIEAFWASATDAGVADRVLMVVTSEFGRRVHENASGGTDHGQGGLSLALGPAVAGSRIAGELDLDHLDNGDVPRTVDTRSLYGEALRWLGGPVDEVLGGEFEPLGLLA
ncbi:MAG: DUF1501 domain-containing protein [Actinomyces sp.]|nr:MAG: DUF1501 domain-containing protein [Actinomyces sp.]